MGIYYSVIIDVSRGGLIDIYIRLEDSTRNKNWIIRRARQDRNFITKMLKQGLERTRKLAKIPLGLLKTFPKFSDRQMIKTLEPLKKKFVNYSGYLDFTIYLGQTGLALSPENLKRYSDFHELRKKVFTGYLKFLRQLGGIIAGQKKIKVKNLDMLLWPEIIKFLEGRLSVTEVNKLQEKREKRYILIYSSQKPVVIVDNFANEFKKIKKQIIQKKIEKIKGTAINRGIISGKVQIIHQKTLLSKIKPGKVLVTQMIHPDMTPVLKKAKALVTDEGGLLCHAANVAREFGIIAVIGTKIATKMLKDGDLVEVDAKRGIVRKL